MRIYRSFATAAPLFLLGYVAAQDSHESHESHDEGEGFEAAAVYDVEAGTNSFVAIQAAENEDETLAFMIVPAASADLEGLEGAEKDAEAANLTMTGARNNGCGCGSSNCSGCGKSRSAGDCPCCGASGGCRCGKK